MLFAGVAPGLAPAPNEEIYCYPCLMLESTCFIDSGRCFASDPVVGMGITPIFYLWRRNGSV